MNSGMDWRKRIGPTDIVATVIMLLGILRVIRIGELTSVLDNTTLLYLCAAGAVFLLKHARTFRFGDLQIDLLSQLDERTKELQREVGIADDSVLVNTESERTRVSESLQNAASRIVRGTQPDDPWKGAFGGASLSAREADL